jgi:hypothetical protein
VFDPVLCCYDLDDRMTSMRKKKKRDNELDGYCGRIGNGTIGLIPGESDDSVLSRFACFVWRLKRPRTT